MGADELLESLRSTMKGMDNLDKILRGMIFGLPGVGKTVLAMQIAQLVTPPDKLIGFIDSDTSFNVLTNQKWRKAGLTHRVTRIEFDNYDQMKNLSMAVQSPKVRKSNPEFNFGCFVMDESSSMQAEDLLDVHTEHVRKGVKDTSEYTPGWPQFFTEKNRYADLMKEIYAAQIHVIQVAHRRVDMNRAKQEVISPDFLPSLQGVVLKPLTLCGYMTADVEDMGPGNPALYKREIQLHPTKLITGPKCKIDDMPLKVSPTELIKAVEEWLQGSRAETTVEKTFDDPVSDDPFNIPGMVVVE